MSWFSTLSLAAIQYNTIVGKLNAIAQELATLIQKENNLSAQFDALKAQVAANTTVIESAKVLILGFSARLDAAIAAAQSGDTAALPALAAEMRSEDDALAAAVAANTPAAPAPTPAP